MFIRSLTISPHLTYIYVSLRTTCATSWTMRSIGHSVARLSNVHKINGHAVNGMANAI